MEQSSIQNSAGDWQSVSYTRTSENGHKFFIQRLYQVRDGRLVTLGLMSNEFLKRDVQGLAPGGEVYRMTFADRPPVEDRLARPLLIGSGGILVGERRRVVSRQFFEDVVATLR